jgi:hypothetical protein
MLKDSIVHVLLVHCVTSCSMCLVCYVQAGEGKENEAKNKFIFVNEDEHPFLLIKEQLLHQQ